MLDTFISEEMYSWRVRNGYEKCMRICDTQDLRFMRKYRQG